MFLKTAVQCCFNALGLQVLKLKTFQDLLNQTGCQVEPSELTKFGIISQKDLVDFIRREVKSNFPPLLNEMVKPREVVSLVNPMMRAAGYWGYSDSTYALTKDEKMAVFLHFQHFEKFQVALAVASSYPGGDYLEFGSHDLYTLRNMLAAFDVGNIDKRYPETQFYAFDIFGQFNEDVLEGNSKYKEFQWYFKDYTHKGNLKILETHKENLYQHYEGIVEEFNLFKDRTHLVQGFFEDTLPNFKPKNKIGFAFLDCNIAPSYEYVLEWLFDKMEVGSFIYMDEYHDIADVYLTIERFNEKLKKDRGLNLVFVRSAAAVGALFRVYKVLK